MCFSGFTGGVFGVSIRPCVGSPSVAATSASIWCDEIGPIARSLARHAAMPDPCSQAGQQRLSDVPQGQLFGRGVCHHPVGTAQFLLSDTRLSMQHTTMVRRERAHARRRRSRADVGAPTPRDGHDRCADAPASDASGGASGGMQTPVRAHCADEPWLGLQSQITVYDLRKLQHVYVLQTEKNVGHLHSCSRCSVRRKCR